MKDISENVFVERIWEKFSKPLKSFIKARIKNDKDADDILQDVFYKVHRNIGSLRGTDRIHAWIYRITRNAIVDYYRVQKNERCLSDLSCVIIDDSTGETLVNYEIAQCLKAMIQYLPEKYKQAIILTEFQDLTQKELSDKMGLSLSGAKSRVQRARVKLKEMLLCCCQLEFDTRGNIIDYKHKCDNCKFC